MFKLFHFHKWRIVSSAKGTTTFGTGLESKRALITVVLYCCAICNFHKTERLEGHWELDELTQKEI